MVLHVNFKSGQPVYLQIVDQFRNAIAAGTLHTGDPLPSIRILAEQLRINRNTMAKAYAELENQGVLETRAGKGCFVRANQSPLRKEVRRSRLAEEIDRAIVAAHHLQVGREDFLGLVSDRMEHFAQQKADAQENRPTPSPKKTPKFP